MLVWLLLLEVLRFCLQLRLRVLLQLLFRVPLAVLLTCVLEATKSLS